jgi:D-alanyl-D-alanine carboxypeptidase/D-alanyl-D-alanine-endopeptidase (penicillin-binding protein 4)
MARDLRAAGVTSVSGAFRVHDGALPWLKTIDAGQPDHVGYNPAVSGLNLNFNRVHFEWKRASSGGFGITMEGRSDAHRPSVDMATMRVVNRDAPVYTYSEKGGVDTWTVAASALGKGGSRWLPVRQPATYAGDVFRSLARRNGVTLGRAKRMTAAPKGTVIVRHRSVPLNRILRDMMLYSTNLTAEAVGLTASGANGLRASASALNAYLGATYGVKPSLVDHSGLGDKSRVTPEDMARILVGAHGAGQLQPLMKRVDMRDRDGNTLKQQPAQVRAKTGSLNFVSALSGYMTMPNGQEVVFAIFTADENARRGIKRADRERPRGARTWARKSRQMQYDLLARWAQVYGR